MKLLTTPRLLWGSPWGQQLVLARAIPPVVQWGWARELLGEDGILPKVGALEGDPGLGVANSEKGDGMA